MLTELIQAAEIRDIVVSERMKVYEASFKFDIYVQGISNQGEDGIVFDPKETYAFKENYQKIITEYEQLITNLDKNEQLNKLNKLNHKINIIFHDKVNGDENILLLEMLKNLI